MFASTTCFKQLKTRKLQQIENLSREMDDKKKEQMAILELKYTTIEIKISMDGFNRKEETEEGINEMEVRKTETTQPKQQRKKKTGKRNEESLKN